MTFSPRTTDLTVLALLLIVSVRATESGIVKYLEETPAEQRDVLGLYLFLLVFEAETPWRERYRRCDPLPVFESYLGQRFEEALVMIGEDWSNLILQLHFIEMATIHQCFQWPQVDHCVDAMKATGLSLIRLLTGLPRPLILVMIEPVAEWLTGHPVYVPHRDTTDLQCFVYCGPDGRQSACEYI
jgi:hypothetical protein